MPKAIHGFVPFLEQEPLSSNARSHVLPVSQFQTNYCGLLVPANEFVFEIKHFYLSHKITHTLEHSDRGLSISPINGSKGPQVCSKPEISHIAHFSRTRLCQNFTRKKQIDYA